MISVKKKKKPFVCKFASSYHCKQLKYNHVYENKVEYFGSTSYRCTLHCCQSRHGWENSTDWQETKFQEGFYTQFVS